MSVNIINKISIYNKLPWLYTRSAFIKSLNNQGTLLDVGCGTAPLSTFIKALKPNFKIYGTDIYRAPQLPENVEFKLSDLNDKINFEDNMFDVVVCSHVIEHLQHPDIALAEIWRVLKQNGILYLEAPSQRSVFVPSFSGVNKSSNIPINFWDDPTHIRPYSQNSLENLCNSVNLSPIKSGYVRNWLAILTCWLTFPLAFILQKRAFLVHSLWHITGWSSYVVAVKK